MKKIIILIVLVLLVGCTQVPNLVPTSSPEPTSTTTPELRPTPDLSAERDSFVETIQEWLPGNSKDLSTCSVTWEGDEIKIKCYVSNYPESTDHKPIQFKLLDRLASVAKYDIKEFPLLLRDTDKVVIVTVGLLTEISMLSETPAKTFTKIMDGKITTQAEWLAEAKITE